MLSSMKIGGLWALEWAWHFSMYRATEFRSEVPILYHW